MPEATASFMPATIAVSKACAVMANVFSSATVGSLRWRWRHRSRFEPPVPGILEFRQHLLRQGMVLRAPRADRGGFRVGALRRLRQPEIIMAAAQRLRTFGRVRLEP